MKKKPTPKPPRTRKCKQCRQQFVVTGSRETKCHWCKAAELAVAMVYNIMRAVKERP